MSEFQVPVVPVVISPHDNADALELAQVGLYLSVVKKGQFKTGDLVAYIPEAAIVPEPLLLELGLNRRPDPANPGREIGGLAGGQYNRVKAIRLRGVVSQGIVYPARPGWVEDQDVAEELGITKWEPKIPSSLQGRVRPFNPENQRWLVKYDIENLKAHPKMFEDGELVEFSEKCHGSHVMFSVRPDGTAMVASKGLGARGLPFAEDDENLYNRVFYSLKVKDKLAAVADQMGADALILCGEIFGAGVQDLTYGYNAQVNPGYRAFDCAVVTGFDKRWMDSAELDALLAEIGVLRVPILYRGPYSLDVVKEYTSGKTTFGANHIREGIVINTLVERHHPKWGRAKLKSVSEDYLLRKGEVTEYQ